MNARSDFAWGKIVIILLAVVLLFPWLRAQCHPAFIKPRKESQAKACVNNLRIMAAGKEQAAFALRWTDGTAIPVGSDAETNVLNYVKNNVKPRCPAHGTYSWNPVGSHPTCSIATNATPAHTL